MVIYHGFLYVYQRLSDESRSSWALALPQSPWRSWEGLDMPGAAGFPNGWPMRIGGIITKTWLIDMNCIMEIVENHR